MDNRIVSALMRLFEKHRIIFWYDTKQELRSEYEKLALEGIEKVELTNNEFAIKYHLLREQPKQKFLLYKEGAQPEDINNWLLDVQLAQGEFRTDQVALWLSELELGLEFTEVVEAHTEFFQVAKRKDALRKLLKPDDTAGMIRLKMLAVCAGSDARVDNVLETLLSELAEEADSKVKLIERCHLADFLWQQVQRHYAYQSATPTLKDFVIELFKSCYAMGTEGEVKLNNDALVFLKRWKDSRVHQQAFEKLSEDCAEILGVEADLHNRDLRNLIELDYFRLIDQKVISGLVHAVSTRTVTAGDVALWVRQRRQGHWYSDFKHLYSAIDVASQFMSALDSLQLNMPTPTDAIQNYANHWYRVDQLYRQFVFALKVSGQTSLLNELADKVENLYTNRYLLPLNNAWQQHVNAMKSWQVADVVSQQRFFNRWVNLYLAKEKKVFVIISDAFRYEAGEEMVSRIRQEDRYQADLDCALSMLPSYTQLGMAALLPNETLSIADDDSGTVLVGEQSSQGTENRSKILKTFIGERAVAIKATQLLDMTASDSRELTKANDVIYIYHNRIDHHGDKLQSEGDAFEATEQTLDELMRLIKKLANANANNILITADHGFIYQNRQLEDSDFIDEEVIGKDIRYRDRRFVLGKGFSEQNGFRHFTSAALGLSGDMEVQIPKSISRRRMKGSGSRFVHGGASLQEVIIPVIKINKKRQSDVVSVDVDILRAGNTTITTSQLAVTLYQSEAVTDKIQPRQLKAGIYTEAGTLISDQHELTFDLTSENPREREFKVRFVLSQKADGANNQEVILRLDEPVAGTSHFKEYKSVRYQMRRSFTSDFD